jgi:hypothetical protein
MKNLSVHFGNLFQTGGPISETRIKSFAIDHLVKIAHFNTGGQYDAMLNDTQLAYTAFFGEITDEDAMKALQKSRTRSVDLFIKSFKGQISDVRDVIASVLKAKSPEYLEFFPRGVSEYTNATKSNIDVLLDRFKVKIISFSTSFSAVFVAQVKAFSDQYDMARGAQLATKEDVSAYIGTTAEKREKLEKQMSKNVMTLAIEFYDEPEKALAFFNQGLLRKRSHPKTGEINSEYTLAVPEGMNVIADFTLKNEPGYYLLIANTGGGPVFFYSAADTTGLPVPATAIELAAGAEGTYSAAQLGSPGNPYLFFFIKEPDSEGEVTISEVDSPDI